MRVDRPYPEWWHKRKEFATGTRAEPVAVPDAPSHWDYVMKRIDDILVDQDDTNRTRALLFEYMDTLLSIFGYCAGLRHLSLPISAVLLLRHCLSSYFTACYRGTAAATLPFVIFHRLSGTTPVSPTGRWTRSASSSPAASQR